MFALRNGNWLNFMIPMDDDELDKHNRFLELIPFMGNSTNEVRRILSKFYSLWN